MWVNVNVVVSVMVVVAGVRGLAEGGVREGGVTIARWEVEGESSCQHMPPPTPPTRWGENSPASPFSPNLPPPHPKHSSPAYTPPPPPPCNTIYSIIISDSQALSPDLH